MLLTEAEALAALPNRGFLREWVRYAHKATDANLSYHIPVGLSLMTQLLPGNLCMWRGQRRTYTNLFSLIVGPSSASRKTESILLGLDLLTELKIPPMEDPASREALVQFLFNKSKQLLAYPEFKDFMLPASSPSSAKAQIKIALNGAYDCAPMSNVTVGALRKKQENVHVPDPRLSFLASSDPTLLSDVATTTDWQGGFFARFFFVYARRVRFIPPTQAPDFKARQDIIYKMEVLKEKGGMIKGNNRCVGFTDEAAKLYTAWSQKIDARAARAIYPPLITRATALACKIATLLAADIGSACCDGDWRIGIEETRSAIAIAELHIKSAINVSAFIHEDKEGLWRNRIMNVLADSGQPQPVSEILRKTKLGLRDFRVATETLMAMRAINNTPATSSTEAHWYITDFHRDQLKTQEESEDHALPQVPSVFPEDVASGNGKSAHSTTNVVASHPPIQQAEPQSAQKPSAKQPRYLWY